MPALVAFILRHFANGFLIGSAACLTALSLRPDTVAATLITDSPLGTFLLMFAAGSSFGMGSLATALWMAADT